MIRQSIFTASLVGIASLVSSATAQEMIVNGRFEEGISFAGNNDATPKGWTLHETRDNEDSTALPAHGDNGPRAAGKRSWRCRRDAGSGTGDWTTLEQALNVNVQPGDSLVLQMDVKVISHSLEAGGWSYPGWEWPVEVFLFYKDVDDNNRSFALGWYLANPGDGRADDGHQDFLVPGGKWIPNTFDLMSMIPDLKTITKIRVGGSGWAYDGFVDNISLLKNMPHGPVKR